jgi:hypothetical protein
MAKPPITTKPISAFAASAARIAICSGILFALLLLSLHLLEPEFDLTWRFISEYALGRFGWMMHLAFLALATSLASAGAAIASQIRNVVSFIGLAVLGIGAIGILIAAIFTTDAATTSREAATFSGKMHVLGASLDYTPVAALLLSFSLARNQAWRPIRKWLFITTGITWIALAAFMAVLPYDGKVGPGGRAGLFGRFLVLSYLGWLLTVSVHTLKLRKQQQNFKPA